MSKVYVVQSFRMGPNSRNEAVEIGTLFKTQRLKGILVRTGLETLTLHLHSYPFASGLIKVAITNVDRDRRM